MSAEQKQDAEEKKYEQTKHQRVRLTTDMNQIMAKCIETIHVENKLSAECQQTAARTDELKNELRAVKTLWNRCASSIEEYNTFVATNKQHIKETNARFSALWSDFESKWKQWTSKDIVVWFQYKMMTKNTPQQQNSNWDSIGQQILGLSISGEYLPKFNDLTFKFVGIEDEEIVTYLTSQIVILVQRGENEIPAEYVCPITKQLMRDPVIAFDGHSYEREAIEEYLKKHNKSPKTGAVADYVVVFPNHKLRADITQFMQQTNGQQAENMHMAKLEGAGTDFI